MDATKITFRKLSKIATHTKCAYLYSNGDLLLSTEETYKNKTVSFRHVVRHFADVRILDYDKSSPPTMVSRVILERENWGALFLSRPRCVEFIFNNDSTCCKQEGFGYQTLKFYYANTCLAFSYLSRHGSYTPHLVCGDVHFQRGDDLRSPEENFGETIDNVWTLDDEPE